MTQQDPSQAAAMRPEGMPKEITGFLFDLDGVLTDTASLHASAWRDLFDAFLEDRSTEDHPLAPFSHDDYLDLVDGRPRLDGIRAFLASRDLQIPEGDPSDGLAFATVHGLGARKNELFLRKLRAEGATVFPATRPFLESVRAAGLACAVVSSSRNAELVLESTGLRALVDAVVDGNVAAELHLAGKPAPDTFLHGAEVLGIKPHQAAVFEDAIAGVAAGRAGDFGWVVGVDRSQHAADLLDAGADVAVSGLEELSWS